jgi:hypothetical protein
MFALRFIPDGNKNEKYKIINTMTSTDLSFALFSVDRSINFESVIRQLCDVNFSVAQSVAFYYFMYAEYDCGERVTLEELDKIHTIFQDTSVPYEFQFQVGKNRFKTNNECTVCMIGHYMSVAQKTYKPGSMTLKKFVESIESDGNKK